jgi:uncharacterized protein YkwD
MSGCVAGLLLAAAWGACPVARAVAAGPTVTFLGVVQDADTGAPLGGVRVAIGAVGVLTDGGGHYKVTIAAARTVKIIASAPAYLPRVAVFTSSGSPFSGQLTFDFKGSWGLRQLSRLTAVFTGAVEEAGTGRSVGGAVVSGLAVALEGLAKPAQRALADGGGHYSLTLAAAPSILLAATALGYQDANWRVVHWSATGDPVLYGQIAFDFSGAWGLQSVFRSGRDDTLSGFSQVVPAATSAINFKGVASTRLEESFAVTYPSGDAALLPLRIQGGQFSGRLALDHGGGVYQLEINRATGDAAFNLPVYYGTPYSPTPLQPAPPPSDPHAPAYVLEAETLARLNALRARYHRAPFAMNHALEAGARAHSSDVATHNALMGHPHDGSDGSSPFTRIARAHLATSAASEDIGFGTSIEQALDGLMNSPAHRVAILSPALNQIGAGVARRPDGTLVVTIDFVQTTSTAAASS